MVTVFGPPFVPQPFPTSIWVEVVGPLMVKVVDDMLGVPEEDWDSPEVVDIGGVLVVVVGS